MSDTAIGTRAAVPPALARLAEACGVGVVLLNAARVPTFANAAARRLLALPETDDISAGWSHIDAILAGSLARSPFDARLPVTTPVSVGDRELRVDLYALDDGGTADRLAIVQEAPRGAAAALRHAARDRDLAWLARDLAHDLKGVLNLIVVNLALLSNVAAADDADPDAQEAGQRYASVIRRQIGRLDDALATLLDHTVLSRGTPERFDLGHCGQQAVQLASPRAVRLDVAVEVDVPAASVVVDGYQDRMVVAVLSLIVNALQAMPGGGRLQLAVRPAEGGRVRLLVTDTGPGLRPDAQQTLSGPLEGTPAGPGVGLRAARETIEAHGGRLRYEPGPEGRGSRFTIDLPAAAPFPAT